MKNKYKITILAALLFFTGMTSNNLHAFAEPEDLTPEQIIQNIQEYDSKIEENMDKLNDLKNEIAEKENDIKDNKEQLILAEEKVEEKDEQLSERLRGIQTSGGVSATSMKYLDVLFSSGDVLDVLKKASLISQICTSDTNLLLEAKESKEELIEIKTNIEKENEELQKNKEEVEKQIKDLEDQKEKLLKYVEENSLLLSNGADIFVPITLPSDISEQAKALIEESEKYLKVPYLWGGESPEGFDCSGLMQYVFRSQEIDIPRVSEEQQSFAKPISMAEIKPGDLVFNKSSQSTHVGMYIGDDMFIHAPHTGDIVKITKLSTSNMKYAGRVID